MTFAVYSRYFYYFFISVVAVVVLVFCARFKLDNENKLEVCALHRTYAAVFLAL